MSKRFVLVSSGAKTMDILNCAPLTGEVVEVMAKGLPKWVFDRINEEKEPAALNTMGGLYGITRIMQNLR